MNFIECKLERIDIKNVYSMDGSSSSYCNITLKEKSGERICIIDRIGVNEGSHMKFHLRGVVAERPLTYETQLEILAQNRVAIKSVAVVKEEDGIHFGEIITESIHGVFRIDARPSDAINIAIRKKLPILVNEELLFNPEECPSYLECNEYLGYNDNELQEVYDEAIEKEDYEELKEISKEMKKRGSSKFKF